MDQFCFQRMDDRTFEKQPSKINRRGPYLETKCSKTYLDVVEFQIDNNNYPSRLRLV